MQKITTLRLLGTLKAKMSDHGLNPAAWKCRFHGPRVVDGEISVGYDSWKVLWGMSVCECEGFVSGLAIWERFLVLQIAWGGCEVGREGLLCTERVDDLGRNRAFLPSRRWMV